MNIRVDDSTIAEDHTGDESSRAEELEVQTIPERLEYLRSRLDAEDISMGELLELQGLADHIEPGDVQLAEAAGIDEQEFARRSA